MSAVDSGERDSRPVRDVLHGPVAQTAGAPGVTVSDEPIREYVNRPNRFHSMGARAWGETIRDFAAGGEILWRLTWRDIASRYRQSLLGLGWAILTPLAMVLVFVYLENAEVMAAGPTGVPYPLFLYSGLLPWQLFQACLQRTTLSLVANASLVTRVRL